jgi:hypothetical protein
MRVRRLGIVAVCVVVGVVPLLAAEPVGAAKPPRPARGAVRCTISGKLSFSPALTSTPRTVRASIRGNLSCPLVVTNNSSVFSTGKINLSSPAYTATCASPVPPALSVSMRWKTTSGGKLIGSDVAFGSPVNAAARPVHYDSGLVSGSYAGGVPDARLNWPGGACGPKGLKRTAASGTISLSNCVRNIITRVRPAQTEDGDVWWVVTAPECGYGQANRPTGTVSWSHAAPDNLPQCTGVEVPLQRVWPSEEYWGVDTDINLPAGEACFGRITLVYTGDARYLPGSL